MGQPVGKVKKMKKYNISFGNGTAWLETRIIEVEDFEHEQDALDKMIDKLENEGSEGYFITLEETQENGGDYYEDEYIIGGGSGRILLHYGNFNIELIED